MGTDSLGELARRDLDKNILVEAGAGTGKTALLVERILARVEGGTPIAQIAAITFTVKAANELRERLQEGLEERLRKEGSEVYATALRDLPGCFVGTIHAFCARLLRERPLEVRLAPGFQVLDEEAWAFHKEQFWSEWIDTLPQDHPELWQALVDIGVDPFDLEESFELVVQNPDVRFPVARVPLPDIRACRARLRALLKKAKDIVPRERPPGGWDRVQKKLRFLFWHGRHHDWKDPARFCQALALLYPANWHVTPDRWASENRDKARKLANDLETFCAANERLLVQWYEYCYPLLMTVLQKAACAFEARRRKLGLLGYVDLLVCAAQLLRENQEVRREFGARWCFLHVDEFQDTDRLQAEILFLLASQPGSCSADWQEIEPRPGALFVVGDPKQSIYRFRRADISTYTLVSDRFRQFGLVLPLDRTHRCRPRIAEFVNEHFSAAFPSVATRRQAAFQQMRSAARSQPDDGVHAYVVTGAETGRMRRSKKLQEHADALAQWIANELASGNRRPEDFLVLTYTRDAVAVYARALAARNVGVSATGAKFSLELELRELVTVLAALADPENPVKVVAALEGLCFGLSPGDLYDGVVSGLQFSIARPQASHSLMGAALSRLREWWLLSRRLPPDVLVERILDESGLLLYATTQPLGDARAGALRYVVELLRYERFWRSDTGLAEAIARIDALRRAEVPDTPLRPFEGGTVRVMNLHRAKGLEAEVVILADPSAYEPKSPRLHVMHSKSGSALGYMKIAAARGRREIVLACPVGWDRCERAERAFLEAERTRLLYVAVTRAKGRLLVPRSEENGSRKESFWAPLAKAGMDVIEISSSVPVLQRPHLEIDSERLARLAAEASARLKQKVGGGMKRVTVSEAAKVEREVVRQGLVPAEHWGAAWGRAVHRAIEGFGRGRRGDNLRVYLRAIVEDEGLTADNVERLLAILESLESSEQWRALVAGSMVRFELPVMLADSERGQLMEGVVDAAVLGPGGWKVLDWKTDMSDADWAERQQQYAVQVELYAALLETSTGSPASSSLVRVLPPGEV